MPSSAILFGDYFLLHNILHFRLQMYVAMCLKRKRKRKCLFFINWEPKAGKQLRSHSRWDDGRVWICVRIPRTRIGISSNARYCDACAKCAAIWMIVCTDHNGNSVPRNASIDGRPCDFANGIVCRTRRTCISVYRCGTADAMPNPVYFWNSSRTSCTWPDDSWCDLACDNRSWPFRWMSSGNGGNCVCVGACGGKCEIRIIRNDRIEACGIVWDTYANAGNPLWTRICASYTSLYMKRRAHFLHRNGYERFELEPPETRFGAVGFADDVVFDAIVSPISVVSSFSVSSYLCASTSASSSAPVPYSSNSKYSTEYSPANRKWDRCQRCQTLVCATQSESCESTYFHCHRLHHNVRWRPAHQQRSIRPPPLYRPQLLFAAAAAHRAAQFLAI